MTSTSLARAAARLMALAGLVGCAPVLDSNNSQWTVTMTDPVPVQNPQTAAFEMEWCPALYFNNKFDEFGQPVVSAETLAPSNVNVALTGEDEDIYTFNPFFNPAEFGNPVVFDIGPIGTFYEDAPNSYQVTGVAPGDVTPVAMSVERRLVDGKASGSDEFSLTLEYVFDCGEAGEVTRGGVTCACDTRRMTLDAIATGVTF